MTCNFLNNERELLAAFDDVCTTPGQWAIFEYEGQSNILKLGETGSEGLEDLLQNFDPPKVQYGFSTVNSADNKQQKVVLIHWQGESVPAVRLAHTAAHVEEVRRFVRRVNATVYARSTEDLDLATIRQKLNLISTMAPPTPQKPAPFVPPAPVGSVFKPVKDDLQLEEREKFWLQMRSEEEDRRREEAKRREDQQKQFQLERRLLEKELHDVHLNASVRAAQQAAAAQPPPKPASKPAVKKTLVGGRAQMFEEEIAKIASSSPKTPNRPQKFKFEVGIQKTQTTPVNSGAYVDNDDNFVPLIEDPAKPPRAVATILPQTVEPPQQKSEDEKEEVIEKKAPVVEGGEKRAITLWSYQADDESEISFEPNELIVEIHQSTDGWWHGRSHSSGKTGSFPSNYVKML